MAEKYAWLRRTVLDGPRPARAVDLRAAARRWPGALRECQRLEPFRYRIRASSVLAACAQPPRARAWWRDEGLGGVCLWSELHRLHADVLAWRRDRPSVGGAEAFLRALTQRDPERRDAWPPREVVEGFGPVGVGVELAERALAWRAELDREALRHELLDLDHPRG